MTSEHGSRPPINETRNIRSGFEIHSPGGEYVLCRIKEVETGLRARIDFIEVPESQRGQGKGRTLYEAAVREAMTRGASSLQVAFEHGAALHNHLQLFGEEVSNFKTIIGSTHTDLGNASAKDVQKALRDTRQRGGAIYADVDLTDHLVRERFYL